MDKVNWNDPDELKSRIEEIRSRDRQIEMLINKKSYGWLWVTIGFVVFAIVAGIICYWLFHEYKDEIIGYHKSEIHERDITIKELKAELEETEKDYENTLKSIDKIHDEYNDRLEAKEKMLDKKHEKIEMLYRKLIKIDPNIQPPVVVNQILQEKPNEVEVQKK